MKTRSLAMALAMLTAACQYVTQHAAVCTDNLTNGSETDVDCGGTKCPGCVAGKLCFADADCADQICTLNRCSAPSCSDGLKNGTETDIDCGGACAACPIAKSCVLTTDCQSTFCVDAGCVDASCSDALRGGTETDVDCGGGCSPCANGKACARNADCQSASCTNGSCGSTCTMPLSSCDAGCVDARHDPNNCGGCGTVCPPGDQCVSGTCTLVCAGGSRSCGGPFCIDPGSNAAHCGMCNHACSLGEVCINGACASPCGPGESTCGTECVSFQRDALHCGDCITACPMGSACVAGQCSAGCKTPLVACASSPSGCIDPRNDPNHCGGCDAPCAPFDHANAACVNSTCIIASCQSVFDNCNGLQNDGCESNLLFDHENCGMCGLACSGPETCGGDGQCCGPLPPGTYLGTCSQCTACGGALRCMCKDAMQIDRPAFIPLNPPCGLGYTNCNGILLCDGC